MVPPRALLPLTLTLVLCAACGAGGEDSGGAGADRPRLAFITNGVDPFWTIAAAGVAAGEEDFDADCEVMMPPGGETVEQKQFLEDLVIRGIDGIAISPIDPRNQAQVIDAAAERTHLITQDSDAPGTRRLCFIGVDNYHAGRLCGELVEEALPEGGTVMLFVGRLEQDNARNRRQGLIDELLDRPREPHEDRRFDPNGAPIAGERYTIVDTRTDQFDHGTAKSNAEDALAVHPELGCMVGLFAYNAPACLEALAGAGKLGQVQVVSFDEADRTLQGLEQGHVHGTVTQDPYRYGYESVRILAALARGDRSVLPEDGFLHVPARQIRQADARAFREQLEARRAGGR